MKQTLLSIVLLCASAVLAAQQATPSPTPDAGSNAAKTNQSACPSNPSIPELVGPVREATKQLTGTSAQPGQGCTATIQVYDITNVADISKPADDPNKMMLGVASGATVTSDGTFSLQLSEPLRGGQVIAIAETFTPGDGKKLFSNAQTVVVPGDWGRVRAYFTSGILVSQNQASFSQSSLFLGFTLDKTWSMPAYYHRVKEPETKKKAQNGSGEMRLSPVLASELAKGPMLTPFSANAAEANSTPMGIQDNSGQAGAITGANSPVSSLKGKRRWWRPGINTYFDVRLTSIPVSSCSSSGSSSNSNSSSPCTTPAASATPTPTPTSSTALETFLSSQKTARFDVGIYFPFTWTTWTFNKTPNALFIAPLAKVGFDTPAGSLSQVQPQNSSSSATSSTNTGTVTAVNPTNFYNFYAFGARIGHYALSSSTNQAPDLISYLDIALGPFSNLETLVVPDGAPPTATAGRKRLYRIQLEGILKVPTTPLIVGFNANVGQEAVGTNGLNIVQRAGDDLRFLFGVKFDVAKLLSKVTSAAP